MIKTDIQEKINFFTQSVRNKLGNNIERIMLFGSYARGDYRAGSDFDFLIIVHQKNQHTRESLSKIKVDFLDKYNELAACLVYDENEWLECLRLPLGYNISREGVPV